MITLRLILGQDIDYPRQLFIFHDTLFQRIKKGGIKLEQELRKTAISRYLEGETPKSIYSDLQRSKHWFFKWLKRYQSGDPYWYRGKSRAPLSQPQKTSEIERQRIIKVRTRLEAQKFAQVGTSAIKWELHKSGDCFPSDSTIKRILKSEGLVKKKLHM